MITVNYGRISTHVKIDTTLVKNEIASNGSIPGTRWVWTGRNYERTEISKEPRSLPLLTRVSDTLINKGAEEYEWENTKYGRSK